jgi:hypothetical protein
LLTLGARHRGDPALAWWKRLVDNNGSSIIVSAHHYMLKDTTVASGEWEGVQRDEQGAWQTRYHGYFAQGTPQGASFLYWVDSRPDSGAVEHVLSTVPPRVDLWLGGHTHAGPDDTYGNKSHVEQRWGTTFINVAGLTRYHGRFPDNNIPRSWLLTFTEGSDEVTARCYLHGNEYAPQGWFPKVDRVIKLSKVFELRAASPREGPTGKLRIIQERSREHDQAEHESSDAR